VYNENGLEVRLPKERTNNKIWALSLLTVNFCCQTRCQSFA